MNLSFKTPPTGTSLPIQYVSTLNQLPTVDPALRLPTSTPDMHFLHQLRAPGSSDINQSQRTSGTSTSELLSDTTAKSAPHELWQSPPTVPPFVAAPAMVGLPLIAPPESFTLDPKTVSSDQLKENPENATQAMQQFVGETFYGMLLKQMRNTVMASDLFGNSSAKQMFESQLDQTLVQELATHHSEFLSRPIRI